MLRYFLTMAAPTAKSLPLNRQMARIEVGADQTRIESLNEMCHRARVQTHEPAAVVVAADPDLVFFGERCPAFEGTSDAIHFLQ